MTKFDGDLYLKLASIYAPPGREEMMRDAIMKIISKYSDKVWSDQMGNVFALRGGGRGAPLALGAHMDEVAFVVTKVEKSGDLCITAQGLFFRERIGGAKVCVLSTKGEIEGTIVLLKPVPEREYGREFPLDIARVRLDDPGESVKVLPGDRICYKAEHRMDEDIVVGKSADDRVGVYAVIETFRALHESRSERPVAAVFSVQEEGANIYAAWAGARVAADSCPAERLVYLDTYPVSTSEEEKTRVPLRFSGGPAALRGAQDLDHELVEKIIGTAAKERLPIQILPTAATMADTMAYCRSGKGLKCAAIAVPIKDIHTCHEQFSRQTLCRTIELLLAIVRER